MVFEAGHDFLGDLLEFGIVGDDAARGLAKDVWPIFGAAFLASRDTSAGEPWALSVFGMPKGDDHAR
jgi:hypothetical protein